MSGSRKLRRTCRRATGTLGQGTVLVRRAALHQAVCSEWSQGPIVTGADHAVAAQYPYPVTVDLPDAATPSQFVIPLTQRPTGVNAPSVFTGSATQGSMLQRASHLALGQQNADSSQRTVSFASQQTQPSTQGSDRGQQQGSQRSHHDTTANASKRSRPSSGR